MILWKEGVCHEGKKGIGLSQKDAYRLILKEYPDVMNVDQVCEVLDVSKKVGYRMLQRGDIQCMKVGRSYRIPKAHLFTYLCIGVNSNTHETD